MRREKEEREMERSLRDEQDRAYRESLKADQEKVNSDGFHNVCLVRFR
jgi:FAS-associated factor 2